MRLFAALHLPADVRAHAADAVAPVRGLHPDLRWVPAQRWHVTLAFYGEVPDPLLPQRALRLGRAAAVGQPLHLRLVGAGSFSGRALWLGVEGDLAAMASLAQALGSDRRPYRAHLTVARLRRGQDPAPARAALADYAGPPWVAATIHLVRSTLGPTPSYDDVETATLGQRP